MKNLATLQSLLVENSPFKLETGGATSASWFDPELFNLSCSFDEFGDIPVIESKQVNLSPKEVVLGKIDRSYIEDDNKFNSFIKTNKNVLVNTFMISVFSEVVQGTTKDNPIELNSICNYVLENNPLFEEQVLIYNSRLTTRVLPVLRENLFHLRREKINMLGGLPPYTDIFQMIVPTAPNYNEVLLAPKEGAIFISSPIFSFKEEKLVFCYNIGYESKDFRIKITAINE